MKLREQVNKMNLSDEVKERLFKITEVTGHAIKKLDYNYGEIPRKFNQGLIKSYCPQSRKFIKHLGLDMKSFFNVPIRTKGITGSGKLGECHQNVRNIVLKFGGRVVFGYVCLSEDWTTLSGKKTSINKWMNHSVWETPEGKLVDVTWSEMTDAYDSILYVPMHRYTPKSSHYMTGCSDFMIDQDTHIYLDDNESKRIYANTDTNLYNEVVHGRAKSHPYKYFKACLIPQMLKLTSMKGKLIWHDASGNFSQSSVGTGKKMIECLPKQEYVDIFNGTNVAISKMLETESYDQLNSRLFIGC